MKRFALVPSLLAACTGGGLIENRPDSTLPFHPTEVTLERFAAQCGVAHPIFQDADLYDVSLLGVVEDPRTMIDVSFHPTLPYDQALPVDLQAFGVISTSVGPGSNMTEIFGQTGALPLDDNSFEWSQGADPGELDASALSSVTFTIGAMPYADGADGEFTVRLEFADGGVYDVTVRPALDTGLSGCPAG
ncbi:MAG TPA: hypothetical protein VLX92_18430 [Kofleriaceae bacterium]|nr:hypothetical protein [Kofleriaceae bacterium]